MDGKLSSAEETREGPSSEELLGGMYTKQRKRRVFIVVGLVVGLIAAVIGGAFWQVQKAKSRAREAYSAVSQCLLGGGPPDGEAPAARFRRSQLAAMGLPEAQRGMVDKVAWPQRCGYRAQELFDAARSAGMTSGGDKNLPYWADALAKVLKAPQGHVLDASEPMNMLFEKAKAEGLTFSETKEPGPPNVATPLNADDLLKVGTITQKPFSFSNVSLDPIAGEVRHILIQDPDLPESPLLCAHGKDLTCHRLPEALAKSKHGLMLIGTTAVGAAPLVFAGQRGQAGVFRSDTGEEVYAMSTSSAYVAADGSVTAIAQDEQGKSYLLTAVKGEKAKKRELEIEGYDLGSPSITTQLLWDQLVFIAMKDEGDKDKKDKPKEGEEEEAPKARSVHVYSAKVDAASGKIEKPADLGEVAQMIDMPIAGGEQDVWGCRSSTGTVAVVQGVGTKALFNVDGKWTAPLEVYLNRAPLCDPGGFGTATFRPGTESEPWNATVAHTRCTTAGCKGG
ncbi:MAG: hypothetical protein HOV80_16725, partial [Polyangiaceae bacterium]|nr:hypothetical protein [Polyangiaceae bacterium]